MTALPRVEPDEATAAFFEAAARGELQMRRGPSGTVLPPAARIDTPSGSADLEPVTASGAGTLVSWVVVHQAPHPALADAVPYVSALVELAEGPWLIVRLLREASELRVGAPVRVAFETTGGAEDLGAVVPVFEPDPS